MKKILNGKYSVPESYEEMNIRQFVDLRIASEKADEVGIIAALIGKTRDELLKEPDVEIDTAVILSLEDWYYDVPDIDDRELPKSIMIGEKEVKIPKDLRLETFGQKVMVDSLINELKDGESIDVATLVIGACAIYLQPYYFGGDFDESKVGEMEKLINELPAFQIYPIGAFFLDKSLKSMRKRLNSFITSLKPLRSKQV